MLKNRIQYSAIFVCLVVPRMFSDRGTRVESRSSTSGARERSRLFLLLGIRAA